MKIYTYIKINVDGEIVEENSYEYSGDIAQCKGGGVPAPSEEERALQREILDQLQTSRKLQEQLLPTLLATSGYKQDEEGNLVKMPYDEYLESLDPIMRQQFQNLELIQEQTGKALRGELEISPALEQQISQRRAAVEEDLARRMGLNWQQSSAGIRRLEEFEKGAEALREQARYGALQTYGGLGSAGTQMLSQTPTGQITTATGLGTYPSSLIPYYQGALGPYERQRQLEYQAKSQRASGLGGLLGTVGGIALGAAMGGLPGAAIGGGLGGSGGTSLGYIT